MRGFIASVESQPLGKREVMAISDVSTLSPLPRPCTEKDWWIMLKKQATFYCDLQRKFLWLWKDVPSYVSQMQEIIADPSVACPGELKKKQVRPVP